jgi:cation:H+ antiporter
VLTNVLLLVLGLGLLWKSADLVVDGALIFARRFKVSEIAIGLTLVSVGTSLPELVVNVVASFRGSADLAIANVLGSNVANILLILGIAAFVRALPIRDMTLYSEIPFSMTAALLVGFLANAHIFSPQETPLSLSRLDGAILLAFFGLFGAYIYRAWGKEKTSAPEHHPPDRPRRPRLGFVAGCVGLALGGHWAVSGALGVGDALGVSDTLMGLTAVAVGTSLPELVTSVVAARRGQAGLAVGNAIGSNIFNLLWVLGVSTLIRPLPFDVISNMDILAVLASTALLLFAVAAGRPLAIDRREGATFLLAYVCYIGFVIQRG